MKLNEDALRAAIVAADNLCFKNYWRQVPAPILTAAIRAYLDALPKADEGPTGFEWIDKLIEVHGGDYTYTGQLLCSFPKRIGGLVRYIVRDENGRLFIHNAGQCRMRRAPPQSDPGDECDSTTCKEHDRLPALERAVKRVLDTEAAAGRILREDTAFCDAFAALRTLMEGHDNG